MPDFPLLGCLNKCTISAAADGKLIIEGPLFTEDKLNLNHWGIPADEAPELAKSFEGKPVRWCPHGKDVIPGVPAEHYCDATNSKKTIVGTILSVTPGGKDSKDRTVWIQRAEITDPDAIQGIKNGDIPSSVSMWGHAKRMTDDGMMHQVDGESESIVTEPAYAEANYQWRAAVASLSKHFFTLNKQAYDSRDNGDQSMVDKPESHQTPPEGGEKLQGVLETTGVQPTINIHNNFPVGAAKTDTPPAGAAKAAGAENPKDDQEAADGHNAVCAKCGVKLPAYAKFCPACGASLHASCPKCGASAAPGDKYCSSCGTPLTDDGTKEAAASVQKIQDETRKQVHDEIQRKSLSDEIAQLKVSAGILKKQDQATEASRLYALPASALVEQKATIAAMATRIPNETGLDSTGITAAAAANGQKPIISLPLPASKMPDKPMAFLNKFRYNGKPITMTDIAKYAPPIPQVGYPGGSYHQERAALKEE